MGQQRRAYAAILGSGFAGLGAAIELRKIGIEDFVILERASALGGTWRDNRYPGCACDIPSHLYSFSFAPKHDWSRAYPEQEEIRLYLEQVADDHDLRPKIRFDQNVVAAEWDAARAVWRLRTEAGDEIVANVVISGLGALNKPAFPKVPGLERFAGPRFHSAQWDHDVDLRDKRVAVIGTGASAIQFVPQIQRRVAKLHLLQRTPPWVMPKPDRAYTDREKLAFRVVPGLRRLYRQSLYWRHEATIVAFANPRLMRYVEQEGRRHIERSIRDPKLRELLTPKFTPGCKRILLSNDYYPALAQPNVEVIGDDAIDHADETGIVLASGRRLDVDAIIYGTGFAVHDYLGGLPVTGRDGLTLREAFAKNGAEAYLGTTIAGFPNLFTITGPNTALGHNSMIVMIEGQIRYACEAIRTMRARGHRTIEARRDVQDRFNAWLRSRHRDAVWATGCKSWYLDAQGRNTTLWPGLATSYRLALRFRPPDFVLGQPAPVHISEPGTTVASESRMRTLTPHDHGDSPPWPA